jgi:hypothetical protein
MTRRALLATLTVVMAISAFAARSPWDIRTSAIRFPFDRFVLATRLPEGWSVDGGQVLPPEEMRHACRVRGDVYSDRDWNRTLAAGLEPDNAARSAERRSLFRVGGHVAVRNELVDGSGKRIENVYIDLSDLEPGSLAIWSFERDDTAEGKECEMGFDIFVTSASIVLPPDAGASSLPAVPGNGQR